MGDLYQRYAEEVSVLGGIKAPALRRALAAVKRDRFLPPGPWMIESLEGSYYPSDGDDISQVLHAVGVAIDPARLLNNANPVRVCMQLQIAEIKPGERVFHVGAGYGYFTALFAELVGPDGHVTAAEIDPGLHSRARENLAEWPQVRLVGDALKENPPAVDLIYSSAGMGDIPIGWVEALKQNGRMILPITGNHDHGAVFMFRKLSANGPLAAQILSFTRHYPCLGTRDSATVAALAAAFSRPVSSVASLRLDRHEREEECWLHGANWCLSCKNP